MTLQPRVVGAEDEVKIGPGCKEDFGQDLGQQNMDEHFLSSWAMHTWKGYSADWQHLLHQTLQQLLLPTLLQCQPQPGQLHYSH